LKIMDEIYGSKKSLIDRMDVMNGGYSREKRGDEKWQIAQKQGS